MTSKGIKELNGIGQSIWYDNLSIELLRNGKLAEYISLGVTGLTSNPSIFKNAIADTDDYDQDLEKFKGQGTEQATEALMLEDVCNAADLLYPAYQASNAADGYVSIEVSPELAYNTEETIAAAERIWKEAEKENLMIKIPATKEGLPAIQATLEKGINVNVTLIFSTQRYVEVAKAYIAAIESRISQGKPVDTLASVASFFVSRLDSMIEKKLAEQPDNLVEVIGKVGVDNSLTAYSRYKDLFLKDRFKALKDKGAMTQRPLWASTSTKNPDFDPLLYVSELALPDTVNTLPTVTLEETFHHQDFHNQLEMVSNAGNYLKKLEEYGLSQASIFEELEKEGVDKFAESYQQLLDSVQTKL